jgi:hypothetical protein
MGSPERDADIPSQRSEIPWERSDECLRSRWDWNRRQAVPLLTCECNEKSWRGQKEEEGVVDGKKRTRQIPNQFVINNINQQIVPNANLSFPLSIEIDENSTFRNAEPSINRTPRGITIDRSEEFENG